MRIFLLLFLILNLIQILHCYVSLNAPTVLLPWYSNSTGSVTYELKAKPETACLQWKSRNDDVVAILKSTTLKIILRDMWVRPNCHHSSILEMPEGTSYLGDISQCSNSILLTPISSKPVRRSTIIMVKNSDDLCNHLRCDVIVDKIKRIEIVTRTRELNVGEMFENIEVVGYDNQDNVFNTMVGLSFQWSIKPSPNSSIRDINSIMKITNFDQTSYTADPKINELETKGLHGSSIMIEPINTGEVILTATFKDPSYSTVISDSVVILVRGDIFIGDSNEDFNSHLYALVNTLIDIKPRRFFRGQFMPISLPSNQYLVKITDDGVVGIEHGKIRTKKLGHSDVAVVDNYIPIGKHSSIPTIEFHVVNPNVIDVRLKDCYVGESCWYFASKSVVNLTVNLFYNINPINIDDNIVLLTEIKITNEKIAKLYNVHKNGSSFSVDALIKGQTELTVTVKGYINDKRVTTTFEKPLQFYKSFYVVDPITILPLGSTVVVKEIYLTELPRPYNHPITLFLKAQGGTEQFQWKLDESNPHPKVVTLTNAQTGKIIVNPMIGVYKVLISDTVASFANGISAVLTLIIQPIDHLKFSQSHYEIYTNETLSADIDIYIKHPVSKAYHRVCKYGLLPFVFKTDIMRQTLFLYKESTQKLSSGAQLILSEHGDYQLHASLKLADRPLLKASSLVRAYDHLNVVRDHCDIFNALPGSDIVITTMGGPFPTQSQVGEGGFFAKVELVNVSDTSNIFSQSFPMITYGNPKSDSDRYTFVLSCLKVGLNSVRITLGNKPTNANRNPLVESIIIADVECVHPADYDLSNMVSIVGYENISTNRHCLNTHHLRFDVDFVMELQLIHRVKNTPICSFPNITNAQAHLRSTDSSVSSKVSIIYINNEDSSIHSTGHYLLSNMDKFIGPSALEINLSYSYHSYKANYKKEMLTNFVASPQFVINSIHLIQHNDDVGIVPIIGGSNVFKTVVSDPSVVSVSIAPFSKYKDRSDLKQSSTAPVNKVAVVKPFKRVGQVSVLLVDECLPQSATKTFLDNARVSANSSLDVSVDVLQHLLVNYTSKVMIGSSSLIEITLFDSNMRPISKDKFHLINLSYEISSEAFINIETASSLWPDTEYSQYWLVRPLAVGTTTLNVKAVLTWESQQKSHSPKPISSTVVIETYDPLRVSPDIIYAIPHMTFQLNLRGGPAVSSDHRIEYHFNDENVHNILEFSDQLHSIFTKNEGEVTMTLRSMSISTNQVLSEATVKVYCRKLESVHIESSSQVILQNNTVVVKAKFRNSIGQFTTFGILPHGIAIHWDVPHPNEIVSSYWLSGFDSADDGSECINLQLNELGRFSLQLKVFIAPGYLNYVGGSKLSLHQSKSHSINYLFAKHDFETIPRLSIEPSKSLQNGWFNWKNHDQNMMSSLSLLADYSSLEYIIPVDGARYIINSNYNNLWMGPETSSTNPTNINIDSVVHWTFVSSNPSNLIQITCQDSVQTISSVAKSIQCSNKNLVVKSSHVKGEAIIVANRRFQSRPIMIKVKSVHQISLVFVSELKAAKVVVENKRWFAFPVGYTAKFKLVSMDEHGGIFSAVQGKSYTTECVNCKNVLLKNTLEADGSLSVTMKYPGNVAIKISHIDEPHINFVLRFIIIHGLDPSHSPQSFVGRYEIRDKLKHLNSDQQLSPQSLNDETVSDDNNDDDSTTVVHEITIQRPVGMIFLLSPVFTIDNHQLEWLVSDENNLKLLWKNLTHAVLYSIKLGESKLTVVSSTSRQPHGYAIMSNVLPESIKFISNATDSTTNNIVMVISNYDHFEKCLPIQVFSNVFKSNVTFGNFIANNMLESYDNIEHPFVCSMQFGTDEDKRHHMFHSYIQRNFITKLKIDLAGLIVKCCLKYIGKDSYEDSLPFNYDAENKNSSVFSFLLKAHLKGSSKISTWKSIQFAQRFYLLTKSVLSSSGDLLYLPDSNDSFDDATSTMVVTVPKDGSSATIQLIGDPSDFLWIKVKTSHPSCFKIQLTSDYYSNRTMLIRVGFIHCQTLSKEDSYWVEAESSMTGQIARIRIVLSDQNSFTSIDSKTTWFYLRAAFNSLPKAISIDITTAFFTLLSLIGTIMVIFMLAGDARLSGFANDLRRVAHNATGLVPQAFQSFYKRPQIKPTVAENRRGNGSGTKYNNLLQSSYDVKSNPTSSSNSSKTTVKSAGLMYDKPHAIYDDNFGKLPKHTFKPYNVSQ